MSGFDSMGWADEVTQGSIGNCYLVATLSGVAKFPELIKKLFVTQSENKAGIYQIEYHVRGKPWTITVDDVILWDVNRVQPVHLEFNEKHPSMWGVLLETAWSKIDASFINSEAGFTFQAMRAVLNCPVAYYFLDAVHLSAKDLWQVIRSQMSVNKYLYIASTSTGLKEDKSDTTLNDCGLTNAHAYAIIKVFPLYSPYNHFHIDHMLYMIRDPRGKNNLNKPIIKWHSGDYTNWKDHYLQQIPFGIDPRNEE
jgi:calpain-15